MKLVPVMLNPIGTSIFFEAYVLRVGGLKDSFLTTILGPDIKIGNILARLFDMLQILSPNLKWLS